MTLPNYDADKRTRRFLARVFGPLDSWGGQWSVNQRIADALFEEVLRAFTSGLVAGMLVGVAIGVLVVLT